MAIRKDIDDMLNILKTGQNPEGKAKKPVHEPIKTRHDTEIDKMSVDDLLTTLTVPKSETANEPEIRTEPENKTVIQEEITVNPENKPKKKKIVITGELPDYEALRAKDLEHDRLERERIEAEKRAAEKVERERIKAEKARAEAEKKAAEAARLEAERRAENARLEAERRAMEQARLEAQRKAAEEARLEEERKAAEQARLEEERKAAEQARLEEERKAAEQARLEEERKAAEQARLEEERKAAEQARLEEERKAAEESDNDSPEDVPSTDDDPENTADENLREPTLDELMDAAIAAAKAEEEKFLAAERAAQELSEYDPVENMIGNIREDAEKAVEEIEEFHEEQEDSAETEDEAPPTIDEIEAELDEELFGKKKKAEKVTDSEETEYPPKKQGKISAALENILDEDPDEIIARRNEYTKPDDREIHSGGKLKKTLYTVFGVIFFLLACIGLITVIAKAVGFFGSYASGDTQKGSFKEVLYPAVIMDIESFNEPTELPSDQIITAAIWSMIMSDSAMDSYEQTFDVVKIPAADVESYAVKLFGENIPELKHTTVGPAESRFYYNEETKSYNVPVAPVTYTYAPSVRSATKNGSDYVVVVDYIDELPEWLPETSSKSVEFTLTETSEGYLLKAMRILSTTSNSI